MLDAIPPTVRRARAGRQCRSQEGTRAQDDPRTAEPWLQRRTDGPCSVSVRDDFRPWLLTAARNLVAQLVRESPMFSASISLAGRAVLSRGVRNLYTLSDTPLRCERWRWCTANPADRMHQLPAGAMGGWGGSRGIRGLSSSPARSWPS